MELREIVTTQGTSRRLKEAGFPTVVVCIKQLRGIYYICNYREQNNE